MIRPALLGLCALAACMGFEANAASFAPCDAAAGEPTLTWYSSQDPARNDAAIAAFKQAYPNIKVEGLRLATGPLATRYASERAAGVVNADLISLADPNFIQAGFAKHWFVQFKKTDLPALASLDDKWFDNGAATTSISMLGIAYNTSLTGKAAPKLWTDLLKPEFKGQIILGDPRSIPSYMALFRILREEYGDDFLSRLAAQDPVLVPSVVPATQQLAAGGVSIVVPNVMTVVRELKNQGAPIDFVAPEITTGNEFVTMQSAGGHSPNSAQCFYNFLFTPAGQVAYNGPTSVSPFGNLPGTAPMPSNYRMPRIQELEPVKATLIQLLKLK